MSKGRSTQRRTQLRGLAVFLILFGISYYATLLFPDLPPAKLLLGPSGTAYLALLNGVIYGLAGWLVVSALYRTRT